MTFAADVRRFTAKTEKAVDKTVRAVTFALFSEVVQRTPVDTGALKGAWQTTVNAPAVSLTVGRMDTTPKGDISAGSRYAILGGMGGAGSITYCSNNLPYAARIEFDGWSHTKSPEGMVRVSFARIQSILRKAVSDNKV